VLFPVVIITPNKQQQSGLGSLGKPSAASTGKGQGTRAGWVARLGASANSEEVERSQVKVKKKKEEE